MDRALHPGLKLLLSVVFGAGMIILIASLIRGALPDRHFAFPGAQAVRALTGAAYEIQDGRSGALPLPGNLAELPPRSAVTLTAEIDADDADCLLIKTVYTQLRLYENGQLIYACGQAGSYPDFLLDPPTVLAIVPLMAVDGVRQLRFEYISPTQRDVMALPAVFVGDRSALVMKVFDANVPSLVFALLFLLMGAMLALMGPVCRLPNPAAFFWLGIFSLATGIWVFAECDLTALMLPYPSLLYVLAFGSLFTLAIPLMRYGRAILGPRGGAPLAAASRVLALAAAVAFALQRMGLVGLSRSMYVFHIIEPLSVIVFTACLIREAVQYQSRVARRFVVPILVLTVSAVLEVINYSVRFTDTLSIFFQTGMLVFILSLGVIGGCYARDAVRAEKEKARLEMEVTASGRLLQMQREQYDRLAEAIEENRKARHDLRHRLMALSGYADDGNLAGVRRYLAGMIGALPPGTEAPLCENRAVDTVARHHKAQAGQRDVRLETALAIPEDTGTVPATDLCVVAGNLLENAIEACEGLERGRRLIRFGAEVRGDYLVMNMENGFDGKCVEKGGVFFSRKRGFDSEGVGIASIRAVVERYGGYAEFVPKGVTFESAVVVRLHRQARAEKTVDTSA